MWHLKTRLGVFWVVPLSSRKNEFRLGVNDEELGFYTSLDQAAKDVHDQATGYFLWDCQSRVKAPDHVSNWVEGEPENWQE